MEKQKRLPIKVNKYTIYLMLNNEADAMVAKRFDEDERTQALNNNPCAMCRAVGQPVCKGHGGGGGGGSGGDGGASEAFDNVEVSATDASLSLGDAFLESALWAGQDEDDVYTYDMAYAVLSITLNMGLGSLIFSKDDDLSKEEQAELELLFDAIEQELKEFKAELANKGIDTQAIYCSRSPGSLVIKVPTPTYYDAFIHRLMDKNLLITQSSQKKDEPDVVASQDNQEEDIQKKRSTAPNPFDISKGPKLRE